MPDVGDNLQAFAAGAGPPSSPLDDPVMAALNAHRAQMTQGMPTLSEAVTAIPRDVGQRAGDTARAFGQVASDIGHKGFFPWFNEQQAAHPVDPWQLGMNAAMGFMPMGSIRAFHGSPYDFNAFDLSKIGTGEGAQAYGHGLYFAGNENTAAAYRRMALDRDRPIEGTDIKLPGWVANGIDAGMPIEGYRTDFAGRLDDMGRELAMGDHPQPWNLESNMTGIQRILDGLDLLRTGQAKLLPPGRMYEVNIAAEPHQLLDWDKPLSQQPATQQLGQTDLRFYDPAEADFGKAYKPAHELPRDITGADAYRELQSRFNQDPASVSNRLRDYGVPGIQYLDQGSRNMQLIPPSETVHGQWLVKQIPNGNVLYRGPSEAAAREAYDKGGTRNYVIFDPKIISILRKYGVVPGTVAAGATVASGEYTRDRSGQYVGAPPGVDSPRRMRRWLSGGAGPTE